ncbi:intercellular adhesion molecule 5 isoform X10 [Anguilla rostrata]|uniref:intercellular adhesion molecule 5 isoform X10 n=1 Tax=Anguilla rostrata TaxID=7938 RepID=UPI0030D405C4
MEQKKCRFLLMVGLLLERMFCTNGNSSECSLMIQPSTVVVRFGDPVSVNCTVPGDHEGIGWEASEGSVKVPAGTQYVTWSLETLTDWNIRPKCYANFQTGPSSGIQCDEKLNITVYKPSDSVFISAMNHIGPMLEGKQYQLRCEVQNIAPVQYLTVKWYKGETLENQTSYDALTKKPVTVSSTVLITPTSADDGAQYRCVAVLELGPEGPQPPPSYKSDPLNITVHYKPRITECLGHVKLREGESLDTLASCRAEGNPFPMVTWYRDQSEFNSSTQLTKRQGGQYTLIAKNTYGTANHTLEIEVLYKPRITECPDHVKLREGESLDTLVSCRAEGNPSPMVTWYRDQSEFNSSTQLTKRQGGQYTLIAKNTYGTANHTLGIEILYKPRITECPDHVTLREGESLDTLVSCRAEGNPSPMVTWYRDQSEFNSSTQLTKRQGGQYTLIAKNTYGTANHTLGIEILYKPRITECLGHVELREDESLDTLASCRAEGNPSPMVTWYRNQSEFNSSTQLTKTQGGQYTLVAKNTYGTANQTLEIEVLYKPRITECPDHMMLREGKSLDTLVSCRAEGNPSPMVTWDRDQSEFNSSTQLTKRQGGQYTLIAKNTYGTANHTLEIEVLYKPRITECPDRMMLREGKSLDTLVSCRAEGNPSPMVTWYRDQSEFNSSTQLTKRQGGQYTLIAKNTYGTANHTLEIEVLYTSECPLMIQPFTVVVRYGDPVSVNCTVSGTHEGIGWEASEGTVDMVTEVQFVTWRLETLTDWEISPKCFGNFLINAEHDQCDKKLNITVYKPSDSVYISAVNHTGPMLEGEQYQLQCEVQNIAPVQNLTVKWYKGETLENQTSYDALTKTPVNVSSTLLVKPTSADDGVQYSCVAVLELGPEGPQPPPSYKSDPLSITVHYPPRFEQVKEWVNVTQGDEVILECLAEGNPSPVLTWETTAAEIPQVSTRGRQSNATISRATSSNAGVYTCNATNDQGMSSKTVTVTVMEKGRTKLGYVYVLVILGIVFILVLIILSLRSYMKHQGKYNVTPIYSPGRRDPVEIPLNSCNSNGTASCT